MDEGNKDSSACGSEDGLWLVRPWADGRDKNSSKRRNPSYYYEGFLLRPVGIKIWHRPTLPHFTAVPSALAGLTSLFGMGRGGHRRYRHLKVFRFEYRDMGFETHNLIRNQYLI